ncbi:hypothetical protein CDCA_CDCA17G4444 [Cyanidium caldarium]|uniref:Uncharacterized protein n=1 Tax=Cyanidium caldarium TaxID=2771 RepID=A0AAV9J1J9_CYACA|nr:hypothetical protein CDCA_CDCA17G4444 [Cyanidium caldarium]
MVQFEIEYVVQLPRQAMWDLREDPAFLRWQYEHSVDMSNLEIMRRYVDEDDPDWCHVQWKISPSVPLPQVVLSYIGDGQGLWIEDMHSYRLSEPYVIHFRSHPNMFQEYTETRGVCHFVEEDVVDEEEEEAEEERDEDLEDEEEEDEEEQAAREILRYVKSLNVQGKQTRVVIEGEVDVYVPVLGGLVESFVVSNLRGFYTRFPSLVHGYIAYREQQKAGAPLPMPLANGAAAAGGLHGEHSADEAEAAAAEAPAGA